MVQYTTTEPCWYELYLDVKGKRLGQNAVELKNAAYHFLLPPQMDTT